MKEQLRAARIWFEDLPHGSRLKLLGAAAIGVILLGELSYWGPARQQLSSLTTQLTALQAERLSLATELDQMDQSEALDPDAAARRQMDRLAAEIAEVDEDLKLNTLQILTPDQARLVLRDVIDSIEGIRLLGMYTEPPSTLVSEDREDVPTLFRHGLVIDLEGEYLSLLDCARALEALPWNFYWLGLDINAYTPGPRKLRLRLYTVSLRKEWIGV